MAGIKRLRDSSELKTTYLRASKPTAPELDYDQAFDALYITFVPPRGKTIVHYPVDEAFIALVYEADSLEIVGLQIENFQGSFLQAHEGFSLLFEGGTITIASQVRQDTDRLRETVRDWINTADLPELSKKDLALALA